jgi:alpha-maltose-1-phosphate synthase
MDELQTTRKLRILLLAEGDPDSPMGSGSGTPASLAQGLRALGHAVVTRDIDIRGITKAAVAARTWSRDRARWIANFHLRKPGFVARSRNARAALQSASPVDAVLQYGATFDSRDGRTPVYLFCDSNTLFSSRQPNSWGHALSAAGLHEAVGLERSLYERANGIFTMSRYIAESFVSDFSIDPSRVCAVGAGPNADPTELLAMRRTAEQRRAAPTILFIGREFERKGGDVLLDAFRIVRASLPNARLLIVGPRDRVPLPDGAEWLGFLDRTAPDDWRRLREAFAMATVFTLPARHEPFGLVVLEAMYAGLPVVATRIGALQEMVDQGKTGYLVPPGDAAALSDALYSALTEASAKEMGLAGRERARLQYSWASVTRAIASTMATRADAPSV